MRETDLGPNAGDLNWGGFVDGADYTIWADNFAPRIATPVAAAMDAWFVRLGADQPTTPLDADHSLQSPVTRAVEQLATNSPLLGSTSQGRAASVGATAPLRWLAWSVAARDLAENAELALPALGGLSEARPAIARPALRATAALLGGKRSTQ